MFSGCVLPATTVTRFSVFGALGFAAIGLGVSGLLLSSFVVFGLSLLMLSGLLFRVFGLQV